MIGRLRRRGRHTAARGRLVLDGAPFQADRAPSRLTVESKTTALLVPASGAMRSELMSVISGLHAPSVGSVIVDGVDIATVDLPTSRRLIGAVLADPYVHSGTVADNIISGLVGVRDEYVVEVAKLAGVVPYSANPRQILDGDVAEAGENLSVGFKRRLNLARVLLRDPAVIVAECPSQGLEAGEATRTLNALRAVSHRHTLLVVSNENDLSEHASRVFSFLPPTRLSARTGTVSGSEAKGSGDGGAQPDTNHDDQRVLAATATNGIRAANGALELTSSAPVRKAGPVVPSSYLLAGIHARTETVDVWLAWSSEHQQLVRLLVPRNSPQAPRRITNQSRQDLALAYLRTSNFSHPVLPRVLDCEIDTQHPYVALNVFGRTTFDQYIARRRSNLDPIEVMKVGAQLADALHHIHERGYCLGPFTPDVLAYRDEMVQLEMVSGATPLACTLPTRATSPTVEYFASPEWRAGRPASTAMDIFSLGRVLQAGLQPPLSMSVPNQGQSAVLATEATNRGSAATTHRPSREIHTFVSQLTAPDPGDRPSASEALAAMTTLAGFAPDQYDLAKRLRSRQDLALSQ